MSRYIDADALHDALKAKQKWVVRCGDKHNEGYTYDQVHFAIDDAPTIEVVSVEDYRSMANTCYKLQKALEKMAEAPSIDIVRCQDCRHRYMDADLQVWTCTYGLMIKPDGFCNYGEVRDE